MIEQLKWVKLGIFGEILYLEDLTRTKIFKLVTYLMYVRNSKGPV